MYPQICCGLLSEYQKTLWSQIAHENSMLLGFLCVYIIRELSAFLGTQASTDFF